MKGKSWSIQAVLSILLLALGGSVLLSIPISLPDNVGAIDFRPYWSSSFLLARGEDFSDASKMYNIEQTQTGWSKSYTMYAWFAPTGNLILLPYTLFPFTRATYYWLLTNVVIVFISVHLIWRKVSTHAWIPLIAAFSFSLTLLSLIAGQVNTLVVLGLALFLTFSNVGYGFIAGASLSLTTIKPHLVILTLPLLLLEIMWRRHWRVLAGFMGALIGGALILFSFYPAWPISFWKLVTYGMGTVRETPTLNGLLVVAGEYTLGKWLWVFTLPFAAVFWWKFGKEWEHRTLVDISVIAGLLISPIGWSYDQIMLLFPILRVFEWTVDGSLKRRESVVVAMLLVIVNAITYYERIMTPSEVWFFWVPLVIAVVYVFAWRRRQINLIGEGVA